MVEYIHERLASGRKLVIADFSIAGGRAELDGEIGVAAVVPRTDLCVAGAQMGSVAYPRITDLHMI